MRLYHSRVVDDERSDVLYGYLPGDLTFLLDNQLPEADAQFTGPLYRHSGFNHELYGSSLTCQFLL